MAPLRIVALGSSFAAGPGIAPVVDSKAKRSGNNYAHILSRSLEAQLTDLTSSGATLMNVLQEPQRTGLLLPSSPLSPQLDHLPPDADIVTLTAGGNDLDYSKGMILDAMKTSALDMLYLKDYFRTPGVDPAEPRIGLVTQDQVKERFLAVFDKVHSIAPQARIYLVQYLDIFGSQTEVDAEQPLGKSQVELYIKMAGDLARTYRDAAAARSDFVELVEMADLSKGHSLGCPEPWVVGFTYKMMLQGVAPYHPNEGGHQAVAKVLEDRIKQRVQL
ncbi:hypothetical protein E8E13_007429 [Curvularia kusanoi]|uniref:SGNH hydrolase-type esterase domain-containing protein n=1 Tax=Curvularia kusanoi TaxID=90978 RepID=A0A9P4TGG4_CURKU|nr:hypothetical protein E8E13_007429 [Curvularia kusanoi]